MTDLTKLDEGASGLGDRFWSKVQKTDGCWNWTASQNGHGYGHFWFRGRLWQAHRVAWEVLRGFGWTPTRKIAPPPAGKPQESSMRLGVRI